MCHQRRSELPEADGESAGARGGVEVQAQRRVSDCQRPGGPATLFFDRKTHLMASREPESQLESL